MADDGSKLALPASVLTAFVFPFVGVKTLKRCACVSREWRQAVDEDVVWKAQCVILWKSKQAMPKVITNIHGEEEPESLYPYALYGPSLKLSIKEMKLILGSRGQNVDKFIEKSEFQRALELTQPRSIANWSAMYTSKWKTSYVYSLVRSTVGRITRHELINIEWKMEFKFNPTRADAKFLPSGEYWTTLGPLTQNNTPLYWNFVPNGDGNVFDYSQIRIGEYPHLVVHRTADCGFELHNDYVVFKQPELAPE